MLTTKFHNFSGGLFLISPSILVHNLGSSNIFNGFLPQHLEGVLSSVSYGLLDYAISRMLMDLMSLPVTSYRGYIKKDEATRFDNPYFLGSKNVIVRDKQKGSTQHEKKLKNLVDIIIEFWLRFYRPKIWYN